MPKPEESGSRLACGAALIFTGYTPVATTEHTISDAIAELLRGTRRAWHDTYCRMGRATAAWFISVLGWSLSLKLKSTSPWPTNLPTSFSDTTCQVPRLIRLVWSQKVTATYHRKKMLID
jgi:hypothetical protein